VFACAAKVTTVIQHNAGDHSPEKERSRGAVSRKCGDCPHFHDTARDRLDVRENEVEDLLG